jgi:hypothetical protein
MPPHTPALTYNGATTATMSEPERKSVTSSAPAYSHPPPVFAPLPAMQNGHVSDPQTKSKAMTNGYRPTVRSHRLNNNNTSRRTSSERHNGGISSSKHPPSRTMVY